MYQTVNGFIQDWELESASTQKILEALTDQSLKQEVKPNDRTLGGIAWHVVTSLPVIVSQTGLMIDATAPDAPIPATAQEMAEAYRLASQSLMEQMKSQWTDQTMAETCNMFGQFDAPKGHALSVLINHQNHHRGQMTILMRQADLVVPGVYGPAKEEWEQIGMKAPEAR